MKYKANFWECTAVAAFFAVCWAWLFFIVPYQIGFKEQITAFIMRPEFLTQYFTKPAFLAVFIGEFLTQFFCVRALGPTFSILCMALVWYGLVKVLDRLGVKSGKPTLALLPVVVEMSFLVHLNYPLSATAGLAIAVWMAFVCMCIGMCIDNVRLRMTIFCVAMPVTYILAGGHVISFALIFIIQNYRKVLPACMAVLLGMTAVLLLGRLYNLSPTGTFVYPIILGYRLPVTWKLLLGPACILAACVMGTFRIKVWVSSIIVSLSWLASLHSTYNERAEFEAEICTKAYRKQWNDVWKMAKDAPDGYFLGTFYRNLCLARRNQLPDHLLEYHQYPEGGMSIKAEPGMNIMGAFSSIDQLLAVGDISQATGCALLGQTVMPNGNSSHLLRRMAELAMVSGEYRVAEKYLNLLSATIFHCKWAREMKDCLASGALTEELRYYRSITSPTDRLYYQNDSYGAARSILEGNPNSRTAVDYMLCSYLLGKNVNSFCAAFERYYMGRFVPSEDVPALYQEALLVNVNSEESFRRTVSKYGISEKIASRFIEFMDAQTQSSGDISELENFKDTYWYYLVSRKLSDK